MTTMSRQKLVRSLADLSPDALTLLRKLDETTPTVYRTQERDHRPGEQVAQDCGLGIVGVPTGTRAAMMFKELREAGYVEKVKDPDGPVRYRVSQMGERELLTAAGVHWKSELDKTVAEWQQDHDQQAAVIGSLKAELEGVRAELAQERRPVWRKLLNRPPKEA
jgi:hypothetical protein